MSRVLSAAVATAAAVGCAATLLAHARELTLEIDDIVAPTFSARAVRIGFSGAGWRDLDLQIERLTVAGRELGKVRLRCSETQVSGARVACARGVVEAGEKIPVSFSYSTERGDLALELKPAADETWRVSGRVAGAQTSLEVRIDNAQLKRMAKWLPAALPTPTAGRASGTVRLSGSAVSARIGIDGFAFADASGMHAGEKLGATIEADASSKGDVWRWAARIGWRTGEAFWQPLFLAATGQELSVEAISASGRTEFTKGELKLPRVGTVAFNGRWNHKTNALDALDAQASRVALAPLYEQILKPLLQETALADLRLEGDATFALKAEAGALTAVDVELHGVSLEDRERRRFALFGATGRIPWRRNAPGTGEVVLKGAEFLRLPVGAVRIPLRMTGTGVAVASTRVPILDGALLLRDFAATRGAEGWRWRFSGELEPISMVQLTQALGVPVMYGALAGSIPEVRYRRRVLAMDGALTIGVFDGVVSASSLELLEPFGRAPRLHADVSMKNLDLELLTRAFDFGTITGRIDARIQGLELIDWQPVRFDLRVDSSPGKYPKRISQRAVQNISALGGAGAAAAIQRSFLRFFEQFGYARIGLSCKLRGDVCEMDGIANAQRGFVIVEGGGIPAISVIGYNRSVSWRELVERLKRITQENVKPIVK